MTQKSILGIALVSSLILNGFLGGFLLAKNMRPEARPRPPFERMEGMLRHLAPKYREEVQQLIQENQKTMGQSMKRMRDHFGQIDPLLSAPKFDLEAIKALKKQITTQDDILKQDMLSLMIDIAKILPDEERIRFFTEFSIRKLPPPSHTTRSHSLGRGDRGTLPPRGEFPPHPEREGRGFPPPPNGFPPEGPPLSEKHEFLDEMEPPVLESN